MTPDAGNAGGPDDPDGGTDEPIGALREQEYETSPDFMLRVRRRIHRRSSVAQLASFSWSLPKVILVELANVLGHVLGRIGAKKP
jgi:hypothetical protein